MLRRVRRRARRDHDAAPAPLPPQRAERDLDKVDHGAVVDVHDTVLGLLELAAGVKGVLEVIGLLGHAGVGDADVDVAGALEGGEQGGPGCDVGFKEVRAWRQGGVGRGKVEDVDGGAPGGEDFDGGEANSVGTACFYKFCG